MRKMKLQQRLFCIVGLFLSVILFIFGGLFYHYEMKIFHSNWEESSQQTFNSIHTALSNQFHDMHTITQSLHLDPKIISFIQQIPEQAHGHYFNTHPREASQISHALFLPLSSSSLNGQISVVSQYGDYVYIDNTLHDIALSPEQVCNLPAVSWGLHTDQYKRIFAPEPDPWHEGHPPIITAARPLQDGYDVYGVLMYSIPTELLDKLLLPYIKNTSNYIAIIDSEEHIIYEFSESSDFSNLQQEKQSSALSQYITMRGALDETDWHLVLVRSNSGLNAQIRHFQQIFSLVYLLFLPLLYGFLYWLISFLTKPLRGLCQELDQLTLDSDLNLPDLTQIDEINALHVTIESMFHRFQVQSQSLIAAKEREMQSVLNAMEAQLNPHFLYNTLSVISACAQMEGSKTSPKLCAQLASLLRYSVDNNFKMVTLGNELENIRSYLYIMQVRYKDQISCEWNLDSSADPIVVPKLILQPIVENCFKHGFTHADTQWKIGISSKRTADRWFVEIWNNGVPISEEEIASIYQTFDRFKFEVGQKRLDARESSHGFGLGNTVLRLYIYYKSDETFDIFTQDDRTVIQIGGPIDAT